MFSSLLVPFLSSWLCICKKTLTKTAHMTQAIHIMRIIMIKITDLTMAIGAENGPVRYIPFQRQYNSLFRLKVALEECHFKSKVTNLQLSSDL